MLFSNAAAPFSRLARLLALLVGFSVAAGGDPLQMRTAKLIASTSAGDISLRLEGRGA
jgi:hypothetical protein